MNTIESQQAASMEVTERIQVRPMYCSCCGARCGRWLRWHNMDTGYGICASCVEWIEKRNESRPYDVTDIERTYGVRGVNWGLSDIACQDCGEHVAPDECSPLCRSCRPK